MPDFDFSDGLSEDWVSQNGSAASKSGRSSVAVLKTDSERPSGLPSFSTLQEHDSPTRPLSERSPAQLNVERNNASSPEGTVQRRASEMPDGFLWKKDRMENGVKLQPPEDLFSSISLEKIFKPPPPNARTSAPRPGKSATARMKEVEQIPSSPPILPSAAPAAATNLSGRRMSTLPLRGQGPPSAALSSIREAPEVAEILHSSTGASDSGSVRRQSRRTSPIRAQRAVSSRRDTRVFSKNTNESFSAIDLNTLQASIKAATKTFHKKRDSRGAGELERPSSRLSDNGINYGSDRHKQHRQVSIKSALDSTAHSQPDEDSVLHEAFERTSGFVTMRRGGYSSDESFRRRPLSPSSFQQYSTPTLPRMPRQASRLSRLTEKDEQAPTTPARQTPSAEHPRSSGSPLKLFDQHDTFTKDHLTRRISQFQIADSCRPSNEVDADAQGRSSPAAEVPGEEDEIEEEELNESQQTEDWRRSSGFGNGALDEYSFTERHSTPQIQNSMNELRRNASLRKVSIGQTRTRRTSDRKARAASHQVLAARSERRVKQESQLKIGKRQHRSPQKDSNAKRRRTVSTILSTSDRTRVRSVPSRSLSVDSLAGKKRRDAKYDDPREPVDPEVLAARHLLRPKSNTGHVRSSSHSTVKQVGTKGPSAMAQPTATISTAEPVTNASMDPPPTAPEVAAVWTRKRSVTTADYFREAQQVMQHLRQHTQLSRAFKGNSEASALRRGLEDTVEPFSRPPSREHPASPKEPEEPDSAIVDHLRKFKDSDDLGIALGSSVKILRRNSKGSVPMDLPRSDPPDLRILGGPAADGTGSQHNSQRSSSSGAHTTNSAPTRLSASSGTKTVIGPEKVSHLISENVGKMTFDPSRHRWVKKSSYSKAHGHASSDPSEDDPLKEIPDLLVDEDEERQLKMGDAAAESSDAAIMEEGSNGKKVPTNSFKHSPRFPADVESSGASFARLRPSTLRTFVSSKSRESLGQSRVGTATASAGIGSTQGPDAQALSQQRAIPDSLPEKKASRLRSVMFSSPPNTDVPKNLHARDLQSRRSSSTSTKATQQRMASTRQSTVDEAVDGEVDRGSELEQGSSIIHTYPTPESYHQGQLIETNESQQANETIGMTLAAAAVHRTPPPKPVDLLRLALNSSVAFHLSPLPTFTINQADESLNLDLNYVAKRQGLLSIPEIDGRFSLAAEKLVSKIADVEPSEPFWEYIRKISLAKKELITLHMLDEFCPRVEQLDVDGNELGQLNGAPSSLRTLSVRENCLSDLTAWGHLWNLQYLDVSGNQISSLKAFSPLVHLRELVAEDNRIESLEGILQLDGLLKLKLGRNSIKSLNFEDCQLNRLIDLSCNDNVIEQILGLDWLPDIKHLNLRGNNVREFTSDGGSLQAIESLDLSCNYLEHLDVTQMAKLNSLNLDDNQIRAIDGIDRRSIAKLSWRNQSLDNTKECGGLQYDVCMNVGSLALSSTKIPTFAPKFPFWGLRRLELARCGVQQLGERFGAFIPNVRVLNLNHNAITDLKPLLGITYLEELHVAGNRIARLRRTTCMLRLLGPRIHTFDCRDNPLTLGFYAPLSQAPPGQKILAPVETEIGQLASHSEEFELESAYRVVLGDDESDQKHLQTLDQNTALKRRVYEILAHIRAPALKILDGLPARRDRVREERPLIMRLIQLGVLPRPGGAAVVTAADVGAESDDDIEVHGSDSGVAADEGS